MVLEKLFFASLLLIAFVNADVYEVGPFNDNLGFYRIPKADVPELTHNIEFYGPKVEGFYPLIYFVDGFAGLLPAVVYSVFLNHLASYGYAVIAPQRFNIIDEFQGYGVNEVLDWAKLNLKDLLIANGDFPLGFEIDFNEIYMMGHSSGNHVVGGFLEHDCSPEIKAWVMLSPVDGFDGTDQIITPGEALSYSIPSIILCAGFDSTSGHPNIGLTPCAPEEISNRRFYDAMDGDLWMVNATAYGHMDFLNSFIVELNQELLEFCYTPEELTGEQYETYLRFVAGQSVAFIQGVQGDCAMFDYAEDPALSIVEVANESKGRGSSGVCGQGGCSYLLS